MAEIVKGNVTVLLTLEEVQALVRLFDAQENLDPDLQDINDSLQTL